MSQPASSPAPPPRMTGRSNAQVTKREFDALRAELLNQFAEMRKEIQAMLPREIYEVRHRQLVDDVTDLQARLSKVETASIDLNTQLLSVKQQTPIQISGSATQIRYDTVKTALDLLTKVLFAVGGAVLTYIAYHH